MARPFPWLPMTAIAGSYVCHAYSMANIFPYMGYMVERMGVTDDKDKAGFYAGYLVAAFMVGRFLTAFFWGRVSDHYGRLPVLNMSLWSIAVTSIAFGMSSNFWLAVTSRFLMGALNCILPMAKALVTEVGGSEHEMVGMSTTTAFLSFGYILGTGLGGSLADPVAQYPRFFSGMGIFGRYPYLLPNLISACVALLAALIVRLFLYETHRGNSKNDRPSKSGRTESVASSHLLAERRIRNLMFVSFVLGIVQTGFSQVFPLWALSTVAKGGLDWTAREIGVALSMVGAVSLVFQLAIYPLILKKMGITQAQRWVSITAMLVYPAIPLLCYLRGHQLALMVAATVLLSAERASVSAAWNVLMAERIKLQEELNVCKHHMPCHGAEDMMYVNICVATNNVVEASRRGELNGIEMMIGSVGKTLSPVALSTVFAWSIYRERPFPFDSHLIFLVMSSIVALLTLTGWSIVRKDDCHGNNGSKEQRASIKDIENTESTRLIPSSSTSVPRSHQVP